MRSIKRPNILILYTDQQRQDTLGCYGNSHARTPNLDRLSQEGAKFENFFVQSPICGPSRMSFLTGRYCSSIGVGTNGIPFPSETAVPINQLLKPYGYSTAQIGKLHFDPHARRDHRNPTSDYGFDVFILSDEPGCYDDAYLKWVESIDPDMVDKVRTSLPPAAIRYGKKGRTDIGRNTHEPYIFEGDEDLSHTSFVVSEMCRFLETAGDKPFFAIAGFYAPHPPINPPRRFVDMYRVQDMRLPITRKGEKCSPELEGIEPDKWREIAANYLALVSHVDDCVGKILDTLKKKGLEDNTLVIFTSDHGEYLGDYGQIQKGMPGNDCIVKVPAIMKYPGVIKPGTVIDEIVEAIDVVPTILDYCGIQTPSFVQGKSLKSILEGKVNKHKEDALIEHFVPGGKRQSTLRTREYMYSCSSEGQELLYDLGKDPFQLVNVSGDDTYRDVLSYMRKRMIIRLQKAAYPDREMTAEY